MMNYARLNGERAAAGSSVLIRRIRPAGEMLPAQEAGVTEARVETERGTDGGAALDRMFRTLADSGLPVRMMREEKENLEEVFLRSISQ